MRASTMPGLRHVLLVFLLLATMLCAPAQAQVASKPTNIVAELVAEGPADADGKVTLALHFRPKPGWHGYWSNPGDAGLGMTLDWKLPAGWSAAAPLYPVPHKLLLNGLMNHVYEGDYAVLVPVTLAPGAPRGGEVALDANWLACTDQICVPEQASLSVRVPPSGAPRDTRFDAWRAALPPLLDSPARFAVTRDTLTVAVPLPASLKLDDPHVFLAETQLVAYAAPQGFRRTGDWLVAELPRKGVAPDPASVTGILSLDKAGNGVTFSARPGPIPSGGETIGGTAAAPLWSLLGAALLGGLILNLMPCVFPILSLKALSLARAGESEAQAKAEGLAYTAGVVLACVALGGLLLALRAGGSEVGWAFQLQDPYFVTGLLVLATAITANFLGLFELPSLSVSRGGGRAGAFSTGLLASFVATPCIGPFLAAAMGAALLLPWWQGLALFAALGLGLALPFLALGFVPALRKLLPRPGRWMETFRRILAVPMALTAAALVWLCYRLGGPEFMIAALATTLIVLGALEWVGRRQRQGKPGRWLAGGGLAAAALFGALILPAAYTRRPVAQPEAGLIAAKPFSEAALAEARASGKPVFVWFTADWCLTCKVNENLAIERQATRDAFAQAGVVALVGDWTRRDPEITRFLTAHGVAGVPLYLWYAPGQDGEVLPQVLTPETLSAKAQAS